MKVACHCVESREVLLPQTQPCDKFVAGPATMMSNRTEPFRYPECVLQRLGARQLFPTSSDETMILGQAPSQTRDAVTPDHLVKKPKKMKFEGDDASVTVPSMSDFESETAAQHPVVQKQPAARSSPKGKASKQPAAAKGKASKKPAAAKSKPKKPAAARCKPLKKPAAFA